MLSARNQNLSSPRELGMTIQPSDLTRIAPMPKTARSKSQVMKNNKVPPLKAKAGIFITQDEFKRGVTEETNASTLLELTKSTQPSSNLHSISDNRVKGVLQRLNLTMDRLKNASETCERTLTRNASGTLHKHSNSTSTFPLTQQQMSDMNFFNQSTSKFSMGNNFLSMSETEFLGPQTARAMTRAAQSIDLNPYSSPAVNHMWGRLNEGMNYLNELKHEVANKQKQLVKLKEQLEHCKSLIEDKVLEAERNRLKGEIEKVKKKIEMEEFHKESFDHMILVKNKDALIGWHKFKNVYHPLQKASSDLDKNIDEIISLNKLLQNQMVDFKSIQNQSNKHRKEMEQINIRKFEQQVKLDNLEQNMDLEDNYNSKRADLISQTKKEIEIAKQARLENQQRLNKAKEGVLKKIVKNFENDFNRISLVSRRLPNKEDYIPYFDELEENTKELIEKIKKVEEEINLQEKIELPTLKEELRALKAVKTEEKIPFEARDLAAQILEKSRRNELCDKRVAFQQNLVTNATRGVMTIFYRLSQHKKELGLDKLDGITVNTKSLSDVLLLSGEIIETIKHIHADPYEIRSQTCSATPFSNDEIS